MLQQKTSIVSRRTILTVFGILLGMLILGSFIDYPLGKMLYNEENPFAMFFAAYGEAPVVYGQIAIGAMLIAAHNKEKKFMGVLQIIGGVLLIAYGLLMGCLMPTIYLSWPKAMIVAIALCLSAMTVFLSVQLCKGADPKVVRRVVLVVFLTILLDLILINVLKGPWGRARMRLIANDSRASFMHWWQPSTAQKEALVALGVASEEFKSFPSGHSANSSAMMLLAVLPWIKPQWACRKNTLFLFGLGWACVTAFTRLIMGAHFLTDVTVGLALGFAIFLLTTRLLPRQSE